MVVFEYKICTLEYFLDDMKEYELDYILDNIDYTQKQEWERTRMLAFFIAQTQSSKKLTPTEIMPFRWDKKEESNSEGNNVSELDKQRLIDKMNKIIDEKNNK